MPGLFISTFSALGDVGSALVHGSFSPGSQAPSLLLLLAVLPITILWGRFFCGYLCSFGAMGDLVFFLTKRLRPRGLRMPERADRLLKGLKFGVLGAIVVLCWVMGASIDSSLDPWSAFGMLAKDPTTPSEDFGREIVACYDPYNTIIKDDNGEPDTQATLSFVDLPLAKAAYDQMGPFFTDAKAAIADDSTSYANISLAGTKSYTFLNNEQVDLIMAYRNKNSSEGVHGMALSFPVQSIGSYTLDYHQFNNFSFAKQRDFYNDFFSIMAAQQKKASDSIDVENASFNEVLSSLSAADYTAEEWYVEGFENYEETPALIDIPLTEVEDGYQIELPEGVWNIIADYQMAVYQKADDGNLRYLGMDRIGGVDANGHPLLAMGNTWTRVGGKLVSLESGETRETDGGIVFTATTKALLNDTTPITLYLEWGPVPEGSEDPGEGRVVGYTVSLLDTLSEMGEGFEFLGGLINQETLDGLLPKGKEQLQPGDRIEFVFDNYDEEGQLVSSEPYGGALTVTNMERIAVTDAPLDESDVVFYGVLTDVYQRTMTTERIEAHVTK